MSDTPPFKQFPQGFGPEVNEMMGRVRSVLSPIGVEPSNYFDESESTAIVLLCERDTNQRRRRVVTIGLHEAPNMLDGVAVPVEFLLVGDSDGTDRLEMLISTCAFYVIKDSWLAAPGVVFPALVADYFPETTTPHLMWSEPFVYPELARLEIEGLPTMHFLEGVPITDRESGYLKEFGFNELSKKLSGADVADIYRASVH